MEFYLAVINYPKYTTSRNHWISKGRYCGEGRQITVLLPGNDKYFLGDSRASHKSLNLYFPICKELES